MNKPGTIRVPIVGDEERYWSIFDNSAHAFFLVLPDGTIMDASRAATDIFGYTREEFTGLKRSKIIDETDPKFQAAVAERCRVGNVTAEVTGIRKDGERFPLEVSSSFFTDPDGNLMISALVTDISDRINAKKALEESDQRYKMFLKYSTEGIWRVDLPHPMHVGTPLAEMVTTCYNTAFVAECNDRFATMYGRKSAAEMVGLPLRELLPKANPANIQYLTSFFANNFKVTEQISYEHDDNGNESIYVNNMVGIVEGDFIKTAWGIQRDVTLQKKAEQ
ncbi:MAG TPA: PAS domain S-box protein, partial [Ferruginibacter sp.]|nr:PAS domain S-box protein [Ferruginibacter sp.]